jgi:hypothetical protein
MSSVLYYAKQEHDVSLPCGKEITLRGNDVSRHKTIFRLHQKKCVKCRPLKFETLAQHLENEAQLLDAELRKLNQGGVSKEPERHSVIDAKTGKQMTTEEIEAAEQENEDAKWLTYMALRCIKEQDDETKKIDAFLCEKFGMNWKAEILFDAVKSGNL